MGCISVRLSVPKTGDVSYVNPTTSDITVGAKPTGWFTIDEKNENPLVNTSKVGNVKLNIYLICKVGTNKYLRVTPTETMWIWVDNSIDYNVYSNTDWIVQ